MEYQIITESTTDLSPELVQKAGVYIIPMIFVLEGKEYRNDPENSELSPKDFYDKVRTGAMPTTAQVNGEMFKEHARPFLEQGKDILYLAFSSGLSGTYNAGRLAAEELKAEFPGRTICVIDTLGASMGEGLLVYLAAMQKQQGKPLQEVADWVCRYRLRMAHWFTVDDLNHLHRGGRVSKTAAIVGTMLGIKPVLHVDDEGHLIPMEKVRGRKASLDALVEHMGKTGENLAEQTVFISHGDCAADCQYVADQIAAKYGVKEIYQNHIGPVIGAHSGPGTIALFFLAKNRY